MKIEFLWFEDCPNHHEARLLLQKVMADRQVRQDVEEIDATDPDVAERHRFPGSPTIRVNGEVVEPGFLDPATMRPAAVSIRRRRGSGECQNGSG